MEKISWKENSIIYFFEFSEKIFSLNFFQALINGKLLQPKIIKMSENFCEVYFLDTFNMIVINNKEYIRPIINGEVISKKEKKHFTEITLPEEEITLPEEKLNNNLNSLIITESIGKISIKNITETDQEIKIILKSYFKEAYPDFYKEKKEEEIILGPYKTLDYFFEKNLIHDLYINDEYFKIEEIIEVYFTNVNALTDYLTEIGLMIKIKDQITLKDKIKEKSLYLKRKFGLTKKEIENFELYPAFKQVVHLYCLKEFITFTFLNNDDNSTTDQQKIALNLSLGRFSTKDGDTFYGQKNSFFLPDLIKEKIKEAEEELTKSIFLQSARRKWGRDYGKNYR